MPTAWEFSYLNPRNSYMNSVFDLLNIIPSYPTLRYYCSNTEIKGESEFKKQKVALKKIKC